MKIISSLSKCYQEQLELNKKLEERVTDVVMRNKEDQWYYFRRIKEDVSYALKIETARVNNPDKLKDFFACTIVVENSTQITKAKNVLDRCFNIISQKPTTDDRTHKPPYSFPYDNLRLYAKLKPDDGMPPEHPSNILSDIQFEIQIKTFLQHAWDIATHDLLYKGNSISWAKQRVAYQIKAMLEHAEISISEINKIAKTSALDKSNKYIDHLSKIIDFLTNNWSRDALPNDLNRLSKNIYYLLEQFKINIDELNKLLDEETKEGRGIHTSNLSPYFTILQTIINRAPQKVQEFFNKNSNDKIVMPPEISTDGLALRENKIIRIPNHM